MLSVYLWQNAWKEMSWSVDTKLRPQQRLDKRWVKTNLQVRLSGELVGLKWRKGEGMIFLRGKMYNSCKIYIIFKQM